MSTRCPNQIKWLVNIQTNSLSGFRTLSDKTLYTKYAVQMLFQKYYSILYILYYLISFRFILNQITNVILGQSKKREYVVCVT